MERKPIGTVCDEDKFPMSEDTAIESVTVLHEQASYASLPLYNIDGHKQRAIRFIKRAAAVSAYQSRIAEARAAFESASDRGAYAPAGMMMTWLDYIAKAADSQPSTNTKEIE